MAVTGQAGSSIRTGERDNVLHRETLVQCSARGMGTGMKGYLKMRDGSERTVGGYSLPSIAFGVVSVV